MGNANKLIKTDNPKFMKDSDTGALVSADLRAFRQFKLKEEQSQKTKKKRKKR